MEKLGETIRALRKRNKLSLKQFAAECELSVAQLSKIETSNVEPSVAGLKRIASALGVSLSTIVAAAETPPKAKLVKKGEGYRFDRESNLKTPVEELFLYLERSAAMQPEIMTFPPGAKSTYPISHEGEEFTYIIEGKLMFYYGDNDPVLLEEGDFIAYKSIHIHRWENPDKKQRARALICCTPPTL